MTESFIPLCVPEIRGNEWNYVKECLDTGWVSSVGAFVDRFEKSVADYTGAKHAVAVVNGTAALHIALLVAGVESGDEVLVSTLTFIAPANAIRYVGAWPVFIDAEPLYWQMDPEKAAEFLATQCHWHEGAFRNRKTGRRVKAILPVDALGHPVDLEKFRTLADQYQLRLIEDATESLGAEYRGRKVGPSADVACFSFNGNKILTTGGGGILVTNNEAWAQRARYLTTQAKDDPVEYIHHEIGYNFRLTNLQAAMGCAQMEQLDAYIAAKRRIAARYAEAFDGTSGLETMRQAPWASSIYWMFTMTVDEAAFGISSRGLLAKLQERKIQTRPVWQPIHQSAAHRESGPFSCPTADWLYAHALSLPCSVGLTGSDQERVIETVLKLGRS